MRDRIFAAQPLTLFTLNNKGIFFTFPALPSDQSVSFHNIANRPLGFSISDGLAFPFAHSCLSVFPPGNLNTLQGTGDGRHQTATTRPKTRFQPAAPQRFLTTYRLDTRYRRGIMADSNRGNYSFSITQFPTTSPPVDFDRKDNNVDASQIAERQHLSFCTSSPGEPEASVFPTPRCSEKGCVFPASSVDSGKCSYHMHQMEEPVLFCSHQPTGLLLDPARTAPAEKDYDGSRKRDRRRMTALWEEFQGDGSL